MSYFFRDRETAERIAALIGELGAEGLKLMEACGTHTQTISKFGLRHLLPGVRFSSGPGCPTCVTSVRDVDAAIELSRQEGVLLTTFGDMYHVPATGGSLASSGGNVKVVYDIGEAVELARSHPGTEVVHFAIGFETTAPLTAYHLLEGVPENFSIIPAHRYFIDAFNFLLRSGEVEFDGFICPGHVSTITGWAPYLEMVRHVKKPMVVTGFEPNDVLLAVYLIARQLREGRAELEVEYSRCVREDGNVAALEAMEEVFRHGDALWRGLGSIPGSGMALRKEFEGHDALRRFEVEVESGPEIAPGCRCGEILRGNALPSECPLFRRVCTPTNPIGACMVSVEGACNVHLRYGYEG